MISDPVLVHDWHPVASSQDLAEGGLCAVRLLQEDLVVWRSQGQVMAWRDQCPHRGTRLSMGHIQEGVLACPYHGWRFDGSGRCVTVPAHPLHPPQARAVVQSYPVREQYGLIWVSLGNPSTDIPPFPEWLDPGFRKVYCGSFFYKANPLRVIENFLDISHLPFVHEGYLGDPHYPEIPDYESSFDEQGIVASPVSNYCPRREGSEGEMVQYTYRVFRPLTAYFISENISPCFSMIFWVTPHDETSSTAWTYLAFDRSETGSDEEIIAWQKEITLQDIPIVESQRPQGLPLDLQMELHVKSDHLAIVYRKWLKSLGIRFGTLHSGASLATVS